MRACASGGGGGEKEWGGGGRGATGTDFMRLKRLAVADESTVLVQFYGPGAAAIRVAQPRQCRGHSVLLKLTVAADGRQTVLSSSQCQAGAGPAARTPSPSSNAAAWHIWLGPAPPAISATGGPFASLQGKLHVVTVVPAIAAADSPVST